MPITSAENIIKLENPYDFLKDEDVLAEHRNELNKLNAKEMKELATKILKCCPKEEFEEFGLSIEVLRQPANPNPNFYSVLSDGHQLLERLHSITNPRNPRPYRQLVGNEFSPELFHQYPELAAHFFACHKTAVTILAVQTPKERVADLVKNLRIAYGEHNIFLEQVNGAFTLRRVVEDHLLGDKPEGFFTSPEMNTDLCHEFADILNNLIEGKETAIADKLKNLPAENQTSIHRTLELINPSAKTNGAESPLRKIAAALQTQVMASTNDSTETSSAITGTPAASNEDSDNEDKMLEAEHPSPARPSASGMFATPAAAQEVRQRKAAEALTEEREDSSAEDSDLSDSEEDAKEDDSCCSKLFS